MELCQRKEQNKDAQEPNSQLMKKMFHIARVGAVCGLFNTKLVFKFWNLSFLPSKDYILVSIRVQLGDRNHAVI